MKSNRNLRWAGVRIANPWLSHLSCNTDSRRQTSLVPRFYFWPPISHKRRDIGRDTFIPSLRAEMVHRHPMTCLALWCNTLCLDRRGD